MIDIQEKKNQILKFLETSGPALPVRIAKTIQMDPVFASAILSELLSSKQIKTSNMKIGASPLYLIPGEEEKLEEETEHLKSIEKEAQKKLKEKKVIFDEQEEPATRVALRNIKDFAIPFKFQGKITWKYAFTPQKEIDNILFPKKEELDIEKQKDAPEINKEINKPIGEDPEVPKAWEAKKEEIKKAKEESKKIESIFEKPEEKPKYPKTFLEEIEHFLKNQNTTITSFEEIDKRKVIAIVESNSKSSMLFAFNKIRINETELLNCYKTANKKNLPYQIITRGNLTKKLTDTILAHQKLLKIHKLEN